MDDLKIGCGEEKGLNWNRIEKRRIILRYRRRDQGLNWNRMGLRELETLKKRKFEGIRMEKRGFYCL